MMIMKEKLKENDETSWVIDAFSNYGTLDNVYQGDRTKSNVNKVIKRELQKYITKQGKAITYGYFNRSNIFNNIVITQDDAIINFNSSNAYLNHVDNYYHPTLYKNSLCIGLERDQYLTIRYKGIEEIDYSKDNDELKIKVKDSTSPKNKMSLQKYITNLNRSKKMPAINILYKNKELAYLLRHHNIREDDKYLEICKGNTNLKLKKDNNFENIEYTETQLETERGSITGSVLRLEK